MDSKMLLKQVEIVRSITLEIFTSITEEIADLMPNGFNNTIRWNLGHILIVQDELSYHFAQVPKQLPDYYLELFANRTSPVEWRDKPPSLDVLYSLLKNQTIHIKTSLGHRLDEKASKPFIRLRHEMHTIGEILNFSLHHEGIHHGMINGIKRGIEGAEAIIERTPYIKPQYNWVPL